MEEKKLTDEEVIKALECCDSRLTERAENGTPYFDGCLHCDLESDCGLCPYWESGLNRLAELEDKIEQGTLKEMNYPCNVGDKVFVVRSATSNNKNFYIFEDTVLQLCVDKNREVNTFWLFITFYQHTSVFEWNFDKVFLTREEAEKRLKELQNG